jgi:hypothetical protein
VGAPSRSSGRGWQAVGDEPAVGGTGEHHAAGGRGLLCDRGTRRGRRQRGTGRGAASVGGQDDEISTTPSSSLIRPARQPHAAR